MAFFEYFRKFSYILLIAFTAGAALASPPVAEKPTAYQSDLLGLIGEWSGVVTHYSIDKDTVLVSSPAEFSADTAGGVLVSRWIYESRDGERVVDWGEWLVSGSGHTIQFDDKKMWFVSGKNISDNGMTLTFQGRDTDTNTDKPAQVTNILYIGNEDSLVFAKKVLFDGAGRELLRREFRMGRK
ncbi:MAG: hypothetical protein KDB65_00785 [Calditrichaeota bacterium]|nr:hypothetical protein [Calditrichota bacterium]MCB9369248.1 hypothetical protein [Calditrichota bacterium]